MTSIPPRTWTVESKETAEAGKSKDCVESWRNQRFGNLAKALGCLEGAAASAGLAGWITIPAVAKPSVSGKTLLPGCRLSYLSYRARELSPPEAPRHLHM